MKDSIKREQSELAHFAERENLRTKCKVKIQTMLGDIVVRLYDETPIHRDNFLKLAKEGYPMQFQSAMSIMNESCISTVLWLATKLMLSGVATLQQI